MLSRGDGTEARYAASVDRESVELSVQTFSRPSRYTFECV